VTVTRKRIVIAASTAADHAAGVGLAMACYFFDERGELRPDNEARKGIDKAYVKRTLARIVAAHANGDVNPSGATVQSVCGWLVGWDRG
jgi:tRNA A64-2'-O-ribosylphosphate transferase